MYISYLVCAIVSSSMDKDDLPSTEESLSGKYNINYDLIIYYILLQKI